MQLLNMRWARERKVARLTFERPKMLNAMHYESVLDMNRAVESIRDDPDVRLVVIRGSGRAFCTGIDLKEWSAGNTPRDYFRLWDRALFTLECMEKIVISVMHGYALGGGLQVGLASDIRIATADCQIGLPATKESIIPGLSTLHVPRFVGMGRAKWMILSGDNVDGRRAFEIGLVDHVVEPERLEEETEAFVEHYLATCSEGTRQSKALLASNGDLPHEDFFDEYLRRQNICLESPDHEESRAAYAAGRPPNWH